RLVSGCREPRSVTDRLEKKEDHARRRIVRQQLQQLANSDVGLVADRDELGETEPARRAAREHRAKHRAALRDEAPRAGGGAALADRPPPPQRGGPAKPPPPQRWGPPHPPPPPSPGARGAPPPAPRPPLPRRRSHCCRSWRAARPSRRTPR